MPDHRISTSKLLLFAICSVLGISGCQQEAAISKTDRTSGESVCETVPTDRQPNKSKKTSQIKEIASDASVQLEGAPQKLLRPDDRRLQHNDFDLETVGIRAFESKHLKLYTDIEPAIAQSLTGLIDQAYSAWEIQLGPLPPNREGCDFQMTGYLIRDQALFREFKLLPDDLSFQHGCHLSNEFWMHDQKTDYYRRHLLIHEATHCFMTFMPGTTLPRWYLEGMAEYFGAHQFNNDAHATFQVLPSSETGFEGFGRIEMIRDDMIAQRYLSIAGMFGLSQSDFLETKSYAWSWALCVFLDRTPRYRHRFQSLAKSTHGSQFERQFEKMFKEDERDLATEWTLFSANLQYGYDVARAAIEFHPGTRFAEGDVERSFSITANRGWQSSGVRLETGESYEVVATGQFSLADHPKPWLSEPQGITFRYVEGIPLGKLLGCIRTEEGPAGGENESMLKTIPIGGSRRIQPEVDGTLYLRVNDAWNSLADNHGEIRVTIRHNVKPES